MTAASSDRWAYRRGLVALVAVANLVPVFGVQFFDWGVTELLAVYWLEWGVALAAGIVKMVPARIVALQRLGGRREPSISNRRGTISLSGVTCYARNLPMIAGLLVVAGVWAVTGLLAFYRSASPFAYSPTVMATGPTVAVAATLLALSQLLPIRSYFAARRYRQTSAMEAVGPPLAYTLGTVSLVLMLAEGTDTPAVVDWLAAAPIALAGGKLALELLTRCRNRDRFERLAEDEDPFTFDLTVRQTLSSKRFTAELPSVERPAGPPRASVRPDRRGVVIASPPVGLGNRFAGGWTFFCVAAGIVTLVLGGWSGWTFTLVLWVLPLPVVTVAGLLRSLPRHATLEYEFHDDRLVCYDRWLEEPVWDLPYADVESVSVERGIAARIGDYGTIRLETADDRPARLAYLRDYRELADRLERIIERRRDDR